MSLSAEHRTFQRLIMFLFAGHRSFQKLKGTRSAGKNASLVLLAVCNGLISGQLGSKWEKICPQPSSAEEGD